VRAYVSGTTSHKNRMSSHLASLSNGRQAPLRAMAHEARAQLMEGLSSGERLGGLSLKSRVVTSREMHGRLAARGGSRSDSMPPGIGS